MAWRASKPLPLQPVWSAVFTPSTYFEMAVVVSTAKVIRCQWPAITGGTFGYWLLMPRPAVPPLKLANRSPSSVLARLLIWTKENQGWLAAFGIMMSMISVHWLTLVAVGPPLGTAPCFMMNPIWLLIAPP